MASPLALLKVHASETGMVTLIAGLMFCTSAGGAIGSPGIEALFFSRFGVENLPQMFVVLGLVIVAVSLLTTALLGGMDLRHLYVLLPLLLAIVLIGGRILISFDFNWLYPLLWLFMYVSWSLMNMFTWGLAGLTCDTRQAKRLFPLFGAGGILGLTTGGLLTKPLVEWLGTENLLLVWAVSLVLAFMLVLAIIRTQVKVKRAPHRKRNPLLERIEQSYLYFRRSALIRELAIAAVFSAILYYSVVFPFSKAAATEFTQEDQLTAFLGVFQGVSTGAAFLVSLFLANRLYGRFGIMTSILVFPLLYLLGFIVVSIRPIFPVLIAFRFSQLLWSEGVAEGANQAIYNLIPVEQREQARAFIRGVANPVGISLVGVILLASERSFRPEIIYVTGLVAALLACYLIWRAKRAYGQALFEALRAGQPQLFLSEEESFRGVQRDATAIAVVIQGISSPDVAIRRVSAEILATLAVPEAVDALVRALGDEDPAVRAAVLRALARTGAKSALLEVAAAVEDPDPQVRLEAAQTLWQLAGYPQAVVGHLQPLLDDPDPVVRSRVAGTLLSIGHHPQAEKVLREAAEEGELSTRVEALKVLEAWGSQTNGQTARQSARQFAYEIAARSSEDPHPVIRQEAAVLLARLDPNKCILPLVNLLGDEDLSVRRSAASALGELGQPAVEPVLTALSNPVLESGALIALKRLPFQPASRPAILSFAQERVEKALEYHELWLASTSLHQLEDGQKLLTEGLRTKALDHATIALESIALLGDREQIPFAIENLQHSHDRNRRANSLEFLDSLSENKLIKPLMVIWELERPNKPPSADWFIRVMNDEDPWIRASAVVAANSAVDPGIRNALADLAENDSDELVRLTAKKVLSGETGMKTIQTLSLMEIILFLRKVPMFAELPPADLKQIAAIANERLFPDGTILAEQGEIGEELFIIVSGEVRVVNRYEAGKEVEIVRRSRGEYVGEMSIISRAPRIASLIALGDVRTLVIEQAAFEQTLRLRSETSLAVMRVLCERLKACIAQRI